nr:hypothetical protein [Streptomyces bingchenggensis]
MASALAIDRDSSLETVLPALSTWRKRQDGQAVIDSWGYRETWKPVTLPQSGTRSPGTWLIVVPTLQSRTAPIDGDRRRPASPWSADHHAHPRLLLCRPRNPCSAARRTQ